MSAAKSSDINLLPGELSGKTKKKPQASANMAPLVEYTDVSGAGRTQDAALKQKPSVLSRLVSLFLSREKKEKQKPAEIAFTSKKDVLPQKKSAVGSAAKSMRTDSDLPDGKPLASALFAEGKKSPTPAGTDTALPAVPTQLVPGVVASSVSRMHMPDVSSGSVFAPSEGPQAQKPKQPEVAPTLPGQQKEQKKVSWWRALFFRKKTVSEPPKQPEQPVFKEQALPAQEQPLPRPKPPLPHMAEKPVAPLPAQRVSAVAPLPPVQAPVPAKPVSVPAPAPVVAAPKKAEEKAAPPVRTGETEAPVHRVSSFDVDLLTGEYTQAFKKNNPLGVLFAALGASALLIAFAYAGLHAYGASASAELEAEEQLIEALKETIASYQGVEEEDSVLRTKAQLARELIANHVSWYSFLGELEAVTIPEIAYTSMVASTEGAMIITAFASDYTGLARQIVVFQQTPWIRDIGITSATRVEESATSSEGVSFDMQLVIDPEILYSQQDND